MGILNRLKTALFGSAQSGDGMGWAGGWWQGNASTSGISVTPETAIRVAAVFACVRVLSETLASLPLITYRRLPNGGKERATDHYIYKMLHDSPNQTQTAFEWLEMLQGHLCLRGNAYCEIVPASKPELVPIHPDRVTVERLDNGRLRYYVRNSQGVKIEKSQDQILHVRGLSCDGVTGMSPIAVARDTIGLAKATEAHGATLFKNGARPGFVFASDQPIKKEAALDTLAGWNAVHQGSFNSHKPAILPFGLKPVEIGMSNDDAQFLESRKFQVTEICRVFRVPPHLIADLDRATFANIEHQSLEFVSYTMLPWLRRWESAINRALIVEDDIFCEFLVDGLLRADAKGRSEFYRTMFNIGVYSINEIRSKENENPIGEDGDKRFVPLNMVPLDKADDVIGKDTSSDPNTDPNTDPADMPSDPPDKTDPTNDKTDAKVHTVIVNTNQTPQNIVAVFSSLVADAAERIINAETREHEKRADKYRENVAKFNDWLAEFYGKHAAYVAKVLAPIFTASAACGHDAKQTATDFASAYCEERKSFVSANGPGTYLWNIQEGNCLRELKHSILEALQ